MAEYYTGFSHDLATLNPSPLDPCGESELIRECARHNDVGDPDNLSALYRARDVQHESQFRAWQEHLKQNYHNILFGDTGDE